MNNFILMKSFLLIISIALISNINNQQDSKEYDLHLLACAAVSKKIVEVEDELNDFKHAVTLFSKKINHDEDHTRNFVNLLILNNCVKSINNEIASQIIEQKGKTGELDASFLKLLQIRNTYNMYLGYDAEDKKALFEELGKVKEGLKLISDMLNKMGDGGQGQYKGIPQSRQEKRQQQTQETENSRGFLETFYLVIVTITTDNPIIVIGIMIILLVNILGNCRIRRKKVKAN